MFLSSSLWDNLRHPPQLFLFRFLLPPKPFLSRTQGLSFSQDTNFFCIFPSLLEKKNLSNKSFSLTLRDHILFVLNWNIVDLKCYVSFWHRAKWFSHIYIYTCTYMYIQCMYVHTYVCIYFFLYHFHYGLLEDIEWRFLCSTVGLFKFCIQ